MVSDNRIKEVRFDSFTINGSVISNTHTRRSINGEILKIRVENITSPGSLWFAESGTNIEFFRKNDFVSGNNTTEFYPLVYGVDNTNGTGSPHSVFNRVVNSELYFAGSGFTSGTDKSFGPITVSYR